MTKYQSSIDGLQRILDEYPGTHHGFDYAFLSEEESKKIIQEARDELIKLKAWRDGVKDLMKNIKVIYENDMALKPPIQSFDPLEALHDMDDEVGSL